MAMNQLSKHILLTHQLYEDFRFSDIDAICDIFFEKKEKEIFLFMNSKVYRNVNQVLKVIGVKSIDSIRLIMDGKDYKKVSFIIYCGFTLFFMPLDILDSPLSEYGEAIFATPLNKIKGVFNDITKQEQCLNII